MFESRATRHVVFLGRHLNALLEDHTLTDALAQLDAAVPDQYADDRARLRQLLTVDADAPQPLGLSPYHTMATLMPSARDHRAPFFREFMEYLEETRSVFNAYWSGLVGLMAYLAAIGMTGLVVVAIYALYVAPQYRATLESLGSGWPELTEFFVGGPGGVLLALVLALCVAPGAAALVTAHRRIQQLAPMPAIPAWVPVFGHLASTYNFGLFINFARLLVRSGVPQDQAFAKAASVARQPADVVAAIADGRTDDTVGGLASTELAIAARLGQVDVELEHQCDQHVGSLVLALSRVRDRFALAMKLALFILVGAIVVAMYLPLFKMGASF